MTLFHANALSAQLVLVRLWSSSDYGGLEMDLKGEEERGKKQRGSLSVVLEKLCLSRIRDTNMLIIVSQRTAKKHFPCNPLIRHYTSEHARYRSMPTAHTHSTHTNTHSQTPTPGVCERRPLKCGNTQSAGTHCCRGRNAHHNPLNY